MKFLLIPDKFKNSITADGVNIAIAKGLKNCYNDAKLFSILASDGGDGFLDAINYHLSLEKVFIETVNPLGKKINAFFLYDGIKNVAYIELAKASGVELLETEELDVRNASTLGTGYQIKEAIQLGAKKIIIGLGGSATNDAGIGIAYALGYRFKDSSGNELYPSGKNLALIREIALEPIKQQLKRDLDRWKNTKTKRADAGRLGGLAKATNAKQKGATNEVIELLDLGLKKFSKIVEKFIGTDISEMEGTGAAGGSAFSLKAFFNAEFIRGVDFLFELAKIPEILNNNTIDYIITGEGKIDHQTLNGKLIKGILDIGKKKSIPVLAVCGISELSNEELKTEGFADVLQIHESNMSISYSMNNASKLIESKVYDYFKKNSK